MAEGSIPSTAVSQDKTDIQTMYVHYCGPKNPIVNVEKDVALLPIQQSWFLPCRSPFQRRCLALN